MKFIDNLKDRWLTWRTGKDKTQREWEAWYHENVNVLANDITQMFEKFKYIIEVDPNKFVNHNEPFTWVPIDKAKQYFWPQRELGRNAVWRIERVTWNQWDKRWHINGIGDQDKIFVATNDKNDAIMIALQWS